MSVLVDYNHEQMNREEYHDQRWNQKNVQTVESGNNFGSGKLASEQSRGDACSNYRNTFDHSINDAKSVS